MKRVKEIPMKQWRHEQAIALGISVGNFNTRYYDGKLPKPEMRRINKRVVFVKVGT